MIDLTVIQIANLIIKFYLAWILVHAVLGALAVLVYLLVMMA